MLGQGGREPRMPPLEQRFLELADRFCSAISTETGFHTLVCDEEGRIVRATVAERIGDLHAGSRKILRNEADEVVVTAAEAAADPRVRAGVNTPIVVDGRRVGTFGLAGPPETVGPVARVAALVLGNWLEEMSRAAAASSLGGREPRRARVLCVDDSDATREQVKELLQDDYDVVLACDGVDGLRAARADPPDVVVCDHDMPRLNGFQLLLAMKADPSLKAIPFILATAQTQQKAAARILDAGAHDFLLKSSAAEELRARVGAAVRSHRVHLEARAERRELARLAALSAVGEARARAVIESALDAILLLLEEASGAFSGLMHRYQGALRADRREALASLEEEIDLARLRELVPKTIARTVEGVRRVASIVRAMRELAHPDQAEEGGAPARASSWRAAS
jgi:CheY-like chemotaxis protein